MKNKLNENIHENITKLQEIEKTGKMTEMQINIFKNTWTGLTERFDQSAIDRYKEQALTDSDTWIQKRLLKSMEGQPIDKNFLGLFQYQLQILYQLYFYTKEINHSL